ncbi:MAG: glycosyltransferase [Synechococcales bacterium]|nr:glycosyltransferase [Synechococcales bacterium]
MSNTTLVGSPKVTVVVSPRERFSYSRESLDSIFENTKMSFSLIYVDGNSPQYIQTYLDRKSEEQQLQVIRTSNYLAPNQARNLAIPQITTEYILFIDNDVIVAPGWMERMVNCAEETGAAIVSPLTCIGRKLHQKIHLAGGEAHIKVEVDGQETKRKVHEKHYFVNRPVAEVLDQLHRNQCEFAEFHCMLVRRDIFDKLGLLDEKLLSTREHIDFCMSVTHAGGTIYCEPSAVVTYVPDIIFRPSDLAYFMLRWSDAWEITSLKHFQTKWNLNGQDKYFKKRYKRLGYRRHEAFVKPLAKKLSFGNPNPWLETRLIELERTLNQWMTKGHDSVQDV